MALSLLCGAMKPIQGQWVGAGAGDLAIRIKDKDSYFNWGCL